MIPFTQFLVNFITAFIPYPVITRFDDLFARSFTAGAILS
jgi:hypothetical protein